MPRIVLSACLVLLLAAPVSAQQRPLVTEDPETVGSGLVLFEAGFDHHLVKPVDPERLMAVLQRVRR